MEATDDMLASNKLFPTVDRTAISPHALRRGYVTEALNAGQPKEVTADRVDMTNEILEKHYDKATKNEQMERREDYLKDI
ncbi:hypothetical protein ACOZ4F_13590 [Haloarcula marismortui]|uniref:hypothetical protein n=1 Tax=Haloarcula marismortui TaxID=2238 RepID=UPI003C751BC9